MQDNDRKHNESHHTEQEEPSIEDFLFNEEDTEQEIKKKKQRSIIVKIIAFSLVFALVFSGLGIWVKVFNLPSFSFLEKSNELSKIENIQKYKEAVVTLEGNNIKGTGFNVSPEGLILTNYHVIENMPFITVIFPNGELYSGTPVEMFPELDIAILKLEGKDLPYLELQNEKDWSVDDHIYVIGNPLAYNQIVMEGNIVKTTDTLQVSAQIHKGNSGSPVIDQYGKVIGVVYAKTVPPIGKEKESLGLAVPVDRIIQKANTDLFK